MLQVGKRRENEKAQREGWAFSVKQKWQWLPLPS